MNDDRELRKTAETPLQLAKRLDRSRVFREQLAKIGLEVEIDPSLRYDGGRLAMKQLTDPGTEWDIAFLPLWSATIPDAYAYLNLFVEGRGSGGESLTRIRSRVASAALDRAVRLPPGRERDRRYAEVDEMIARDVAPVAVLAVLHEATLVSDRVDPDCIVLRPTLDLAVACLKE